MPHKRDIETERYYHVYSRGVNKVDIFNEDIDYNRFQLLIEACNSNQNIILRDYMKNKVVQDESQKIIYIYSYCLMTNHFHMIIKELVPGGISLFFQKVLAGYSLYFNRKYSRTGALFGSKFKHKLIHDDAYFHYLVKYIWNNPIKIINPHYSSQDLLHEKIILSKDERLFAKKYPYKYISPTYEKHISEVCN